MPDPGAAIWGEFVHEMSWVLQQQPVGPSSGGCAPRSGIVSDPCPEDAPADPWGGELLLPTWLWLLGADVRGNYPPYCPANCFSIPLYGSFSCSKPSCYLRVILNISPKFSPLPLELSPVILSH